MRTVSVLSPQSISFSACDHVLARLDLLIGRHRVLEVEEHDVRGRARRLLEELRRAAGHRELGAVQARRAGLDDGEAQGAVPRQGCWDS